MSHTLSATVWCYPWQNTNPISHTGSEMTPFLFRGELYRIENFHAFEGHPDVPPEYRFHEDGFRIRHIASDRVISVPFLNYYFATATVWEDKIYVFAGYYGENLEWWHIQDMVLTTSDDLITWSKPQTILHAEPPENLFNNAVAYDGKRFIMLYESDDPAYPKFTFKFAASTDLRHWQKMPDALYGTDKYVGGPAMYYEAPYFYVLYLHELPDGWETRITRTQDFHKWEDAPEDRPFMKPDRTHESDPKNFPGVMEINASDVELIEHENKVKAWYFGGNQQTCSEVRYAEFPGTRRELLEYYFL